MPDVQVVVLAGGECKRLYPLTSAGTVKALLPVGNQPLISFPLRNLADAGIKSCIVVAIGEAVSASVSAFLASPEAAAAGLPQAAVITVPEDAGTADALRLVASQLTADTVVVYSGDIVADLPLRALLATHQVSGALATVVLGQRKVSPTTETKPGKPPRGVDYLGLDPSRQLMLFAASSPESLRDLKLPLAAVQQAGAIQLHSDLQDQHLYALSRAALKLLVSKPGLSSLKLDFIPWLTRHQLKHGAAEAAAAAAAGGSGAPGAAALSPPRGGAAVPSYSLLHRAPSGSSFAGSFTSASPLAGLDSGALAAAAAAGGGGGGGAGAAAGAIEQQQASQQQQPPQPQQQPQQPQQPHQQHHGGWGLPGEGYMAMSHAGAGAAAGRAGRVGVYQVPPGRFCARVNNVAAYGEVNREVAAADSALHLTGLAASKYDNVVPPSVALGAKATVGPACILGDGCVIGDKSSVKRTVMGANCRLGANTKVINCVLMDGVEVGDGSHVQNSIVCAGALIQERCSLKDCQVGPGFVVAAASEHKAETLAKT